MLEYCVGGGGLADEALAGKLVTALDASSASFFLTRDRSALNPGLDAFLAWRASKLAALLVLLTALVRLSNAFVDAVCNSGVIS